MIDCQAIKGEASWHLGDPQPGRCVFPWHAARGRGSAQPRLIFGCSSSGRKTEGRMKILELGLPYSTARPYRLFRQDDLGDELKPDIAKSDSLRGL
jgi:hypothetical protein